MDDTLVGKRIKLLAMPEDPNPIPVGTTGTVKAVTECLGYQHITVKWDIERSLTLVCPPDRFEIIS